MSKNPDAIPSVELQTVRLRIAPPGHPGRQNGAQAAGERTVPAPFARGLGLRLAGRQGPRASDAASLIVHLAGA